MVYYFTSNVIDPPATIYVGKDKFESPSPPPLPLSPALSPAAVTPPTHRQMGSSIADEELIKFGWDCDVW